MEHPRSVFKYLFVRPAQTVETDNLKEKFLHFQDLFSQGTPFSKILQGIPEKEDVQRKEAARTFLKQNNPRNNSLYSTLLGLHRQLKNLLENEKPDGAIPAPVANQIENIKKNEGLAKFHALLWDTLIAAALVPGEFRQDRTSLIELIRTINIAFNFSKTSTTKVRLRTSLKSLPILPGSIRYKQPQSDPDKPDDPKPTDPKKNLWERIQQIEQAVIEIDMLKRENERQLEKVEIKFDRPSVDPKPVPGKKESFDNAILNKDVIHPFALLPEVAKGMSTNTRKQIEAIHLTPQDRISDLKAGLLQQKQVLFNQYTQGMGVKDIVQLKGGGVFTTGTTYQTPGIPPIGSATSVPTSVGSVKPIGIGDLLVVNEELQEYVLGEIAHVENVMKSESRERVHRKLEQTEESLLFESETTSESEHELATTERYELQTEVQNTIAADQSANAGVSVSGGYGPVQVSVSADYSVSNSQETSTSKSTAYAKDIVERSVSKIIERQLQRSTVRNFLETEETNTHGFDNTAGEGHVIGIYRWLHKRYLNQVYNYGKRLMFEFMVPEPAAFYLYALTNQQLPGMSLSMPDDEILSLSPLDIKRDEYLSLVRIYQATSVAPPPPESIYLAKAFYKEYNQDIDFDGLADNELQAPEGYRAKRFNVHRNYGTVSEDLNEYFRIIVGTKRIDLLPGSTYDATLSGLTGTVPITFKTSHLTNWAVNVEIECELTDEKFQEWQISTYATLLDAYNNLKSAYEAQLADAKTQAGVGVYGQSDTMNRETEKEELKRACITLLTNQHFDLFNAMSYPSGAYPMINVKEAVAEGSYVQFMENTFEWDQITYQFYPYFWGLKEKWIERLNLQHTDTQFQQFLRAGFARVLVPVRPGYDNPILYYLETGEIWGGGEVPTIDDELYVSILDEVYDNHELEEAVPEGAPWEVDIPTNLVMLQEDASLPVFVEAPES